MTRGSVLVIDDSSTVRKLAEGILTSEGYTVYTAGDGKEGLTIAKEIKPAVILVDFIMPGMNGYQLCKMIRFDPELKNTPLILISAKGEQVGKKFMEAFKINDYFQKPFQPDDLVEKIASVLVEEEEKEEVKKEPVKVEPHIGALPDVRGIENLMDGIMRRYFLNEFPLQLNNILVGSLRKFGLVRDESLVLSGDLSIFQLPDVLQFVGSSKLTGRLTAFSAKCSSEIYFDNGDVVWGIMSKRGWSAIMGEDLVKDRRLSRNDVDRALAVSKRDSIPLGRALVQEGLLSELELMERMKKTVENVVYTSIRIEKGRFFFERMPLPDSLSDITFRIAVSTLILEGVRRLDERRLASQTFKEPNVVFVRLITDAEEIENVTLDKKEMNIFLLINGKRTLTEIIQESGLDEGEVKRILYTLTKVGLVKKK